MKIIKIAQMFVGYLLALFWGAMLLLGYGIDTTGAGFWDFKTTPVTKVNRDI
ncbi:hypothetical protein ACYVVU_05295 [Arenicellales bacterium IMCC55707]